MRPKSIVQVSIKMPEELVHDLQAEADRRTLSVRERTPDATEVTVSEVIKDCCEFRLTVVKGLRVGFYTLRLLDEEAKAGSTSGQEVVRPSPEGPILLQLEAVRPWPSQH